MYTIGISFDQRLLKGLGLVVVKLLDVGKCILLIFANGTKETYQTIPKLQNIKKCNLEETMDFGPGKTFPHNMFLDIQVSF